MKFYLILLTLFVCQNMYFQEVNLQGNYSMYFEKDFETQNCTINFYNGIYKRKLLSGKEISGSVDNQKYRIVLKDNETPLEMIIVKSSISNDTISFGTVDTRNKSKPTGDIIINEGRMIKIK